MLHMYTVGIEYYYVDVSVSMYVCMYVHMRAE